MTRPNPNPATHVPVVIERFDHIVLTAADVDQTCAFYARALGMKVQTFGAGRKALAFGRQKINLHQLGREIDPKARRPTPGSADACHLRDGRRRRPRAPRLRRDQDRGGAGPADGRDGADPLGLLPGSGREPDRGLELREVRAAASARCERRRRRSGATELPLRHPPRPLQDRRPERRVERQPLRLRLRLELLPELRWEAHRPRDRRARFAPLGRAPPADVDALRRDPLGVGVPADARAPEVDLGDLAERRRRRRGRNLRRGGRGRDHISRFKMADDLARPLPGRGAAAAPGGVAGSNQVRTPRTQSRPARARKCEGPRRLSSLGPFGTGCGGRI